MPETKMELDQLNQDNKFDSSELPQMLQIYYQLIFPHQQFFKWLSYGNIQPNYFSRREFSFTLPGDIYIRYISFNDADELKQALLQKIPEKIDIGAVYNLPPKEKRDFAAFTALERELVFDVDMTDYDDVRNCCSGAAICPKCWLFMIIAAKVLNRALTEDFGFKHCFFIYSGRRGIHCWVSDQRARKLTFEARSAIADYLTLVEGGEFKKKKVSFDFRRPLHASVSRSLIIINKHFDRLVNEQKMFETHAQIQKLIDLCPTGPLRLSAEKHLMNGKFKSSFECWERFVGVVQTYNAAEKNALPTRHLLEEVKIQLCYPRLDVNVSKGVNHLLKSPFSIHPKTGRVCVPIDINKIDQFDPFTVPTVSELCSQIDQYDRKGETDLVVEPYEKTSLKESINLFKKKITQLQAENVALKLEKADREMSF